MTTPPQHLLAALSQAIDAAHLLRTIASNPKLTTPEGKEVCLQAADKIDERLKEMPILVIEEACKEEGAKIAAAIGDRP